MSTQLGDKYRKWARVTKATMRVQHKPGDAIQVDWADDTIFPRSRQTCSKQVCLWDLAQVICITFIIQVARAI